MLLALVAIAGIGHSPTIAGEVRFDPSPTEQELPQQFRLSPSTFSYDQKPVETFATTFDIFEVTFPSPVVTPHPRNNTVHCEYFRPRGSAAAAPMKRGYPAVVVLHILGGDFDLARLFARYMADRGVAALFMKMPYYGPRRDPQSPVRMISGDVRATVASMRQAVLDTRYAAAWLASRDEVDPRRIGIFGISLGGITGGLAAGIEPRFTRVCLMLAGGDIARVAWTSPELAPLRTKWQSEGGTKEEFFRLMATVDPVTYATRVRGRKVLMLNASHDEVIPRACTESLWRAFGEPEIVWFEAGHYSAMRFVSSGLNRVATFFAQ